MKKYLPNLLIISFLSILAACQKPLQKSPEKFVPDYALNRFESTIKEYEKEDVVKSIVKGETVFYGSSSFYFWNTIQQDMAPLALTNRGFGGSTIPELSYYAERMVFPYEPKTLVIYCENDMFGEKAKSPEQVFDDYRSFVNVVHKRFAKTKIYFISMKPSPSRRAQWAEVNKANIYIETYSKLRKNLGYIDITKAMYRPDGTINGELFKEDSLHMKHQGYVLWSNILKPILNK